MTRTLEEAVKELRREPAHPVRAVVEGLTVEVGTRTAGANTRVVEWLLACPAKGFFVPVESESTGSL